MRHLNTAEILQVWEEWFNQSFLEKNLRLLAVACSVNDLHQLSHLSIGDRDARLLQLREWMFGYILRNKVNCPNCAEVIEWETDTKDLHLQSITQNLFVREFFLEKDGYSIQFRLPDSVDIFRIAKSELQEEAYKKVRSDCILKVNKNGEPSPASDLPESVWEALNKQMEEEDPQANIRMSLTCPTCKHSWEVYFDIGSYFWVEINNWAQRILQEVYQLARAFGWAERDILNMSAYRRQYYIGMLGK